MTSTSSRRTARAMYAGVVCVAAITAAFSLAGPVSSAEASPTHGWATVCFQHLHGLSYTGGTTVWTSAKGAWKRSSRAPGTPDGCRTWRLPAGTTARFGATSMRDLPAFFLRADHSAAVTVVAGRRVIAGTYVVMSSV